MKTKICKEKRKFIILCCSSGIYTLLFFLPEEQQSIMKNIPGNKKNSIKEKVIIKN